MNYQDENAELDPATSVETEPEVTGSVLPSASADVATDEDFQRMLAAASRPAGDTATAEDYRKFGLEPPDNSEGMLGSAAREAAHSVIPAVGSLPAIGAGAAGGAALGGLAGPIGAAVGGLAGGIVGGLGAGYAISAAQEAALKAAGFDDSEKRARNEAAHPYTSFAGGLAPNLIGFSGLSGRLAERVLGAGGMAGLEAGQEYATKGEVDPLKIGMAGALGTLGPNKFGRKALELGARVGAPFAKAPVEQVGNEPGANPETPPSTPAGLSPADQQQAAADANRPSEGQPPQMNRAGSPQATKPTAADERAVGREYTAVRSEREFPKIEEPYVEGEGRPPEPQTVVLRELGRPDTAQEAALKEQLHGATGAVAGEPTPAPRGAEPSSDKATPSGPTTPPPPPPQPPTQQLRKTRKTKKTPVPVQPPPTQQLGGVAQPGGPPAPVQPPPRRLEGSQEQPVHLQEQPPQPPPAPPIPIKTEPVAYLAGATRDGGVAVSPKVPERLTLRSRDPGMNTIEIDPREVLAKHETSEQQGMHEGMSYAGAHEARGTEAERQWFRERGIEAYFDDYQRQMKELYGHLKNSPEGKVTAPDVIPVDAAEARTEQPQKRPLIVKRRNLGDRARAVAAERAGRVEGSEAANIKAARELPRMVGEGERPGSREVREVREVLPLDPKPEEAPPEQTEKPPARTLTSNTDFQRETTNRASAAAAWQQHGRQVLEALSNKNLFDPEQNMAVMKHAATLAQEARNKASSLGNKLAPPVRRDHGREPMRDFAMRTWHQLALGDLKHLVNGTRTLRDINDLIDRAATVRSRLMAYEAMDRNGWKPDDVAMFERLYADRKEAAASYYNEMYGAGRMRPTKKGGLDPETIEAPTTSGKRIERAEDVGRRDPGMEAAKRDLPKGQVPAEEARTEQGPVKFKHYSPKTGKFEDATATRVTRIADELERVKAETNNFADHPYGWFMRAIFPHLIERTQGGRAYWMTREERARLGVQEQGGRHDPTTYHITLEANPIEGSPKQLEFERERLLGLTYDQYAVLHEAIHQVTARALNINPALRASAERLRSYLNTVTAVQISTPDSLRYALKNVHELMAESLTNTSTYKFMASTTLPKDLASKLRLENPNATVWDAIKSFVLRAFNRPVNERNMTALEGILRIYDSAARETPTIKGDEYRKATLPLSWQVKAQGLPPSIAEMMKGMDASPREVWEAARSVFSPKGAPADRAKELLRWAGGYWRREAAITAELMKPYLKEVNALPESDVHALEDHIEDPSQNPLPAHISNNIREFVDVHGEAMRQRRRMLESMPSTSQMNFIDDYLAHMYENPQAAQAKFRNWSGGSKQGSAGSLKKRTLPTLADARALGLKPIGNPALNLIRYTHSMDKFIAHEMILQRARDMGDVKYYRTKTVGATGNPQASQVGLPADKADWLPITGRHAELANGMQAHAPPEFARLWNQFMDKGLYRNPHVGMLYDSVRRFSNALTGLQLGLNAYHLSTMMTEAVVSETAKAFSQLARGDVTGAGKSTLLSSSVLGPGVARYLDGRRFMKAYADPLAGTARDQQVARLAQEAGAGYGRDFSPDYDYARAGSFFNSIAAGTLKREMMQAWQSIKDAGGWAPMKVPVVAGQMIGRGLQTVSHVLFQHIIPRLKAGVFSDMMSEYLNAKPTSTHEEQIKFATKMLDSIDNRFGEMVHDNIFMNNAVKQALQPAMFSWSWTLGTIREIGGGALKMVDPRNWKDLSLTSPSYDPRMAYVVAMPFALGFTGAAYQYLKTGTLPEFDPAHPLQTAQNFFYPRTGGKVTVARQQVPEQAAIPGYIKDVVGYAHDPFSEAMNKRSTLLKIIGEQAALNPTDWRNLPIVRPDANVLQNIADRVFHIAEQLYPLSLKNMFESPKTGSNINYGERSLGLREAPAWMENYPGTKRAIEAKQKREWQIKQKADARQKALRGQ